MGKGSANLNDPVWQKSTTVDAVAELISTGKGTMPASKGKLTPEQIKAVAEYSLKLK
jgi:mono/diheme cytochrome c family protein